MYGTLGPYLLPLSLHLPLTSSLCLSTSPLPSTSELSLICIPASSVQNIRFHRIFQATIEEGSESPKTIESASMSDEDPTNDQVAESQPFLDRWSTDEFSAD